MSFYYLPRFKLDTSIQKLGKAAQSDKSSSDWAAFFHDLKHSLLNNTHRDLIAFILLISFKFMSPKNQSPYNGCSLSDDLF